MSEHRDELAAVPVPGPAVPPWRPLPLDEVGRERVERVVVEAEAAVMAAHPTEFSLAWGTAGLALAREACERSGRTEPGGAAAMAAQALTVAATSSNAAGVFEGLTGTAWTLTHVAGSAFDAGADPCNAVDEALLDLVSGGGSDDCYDLIEGLVGIGVYALERLPNAAALLDAVIERVAALAVEAPHGLTWHTSPEQLPEHQQAEAPTGYFNLGVAHGVPGVVGLLAAACTVRPTDRTAAELLTGAVSWVLAQRRDDGRFPPWTGPGTSGRPSRDTWCYGGIGVAAVVGNAGRALGREDWCAAATDIVLRAVGRGDDESGIRDAGLCHGAAGLLHVCNRLWQQTDDPRLADGARRWLRRTLDLMPALSGPGFLEGRAGVLLALLAVLGVDPAWDRVLLLSIRPASAGDPSVEVRL